MRHRSRFRPARLGRRLLLARWSLRDRGQGDRHRPAAARSPAHGAALRAETGVLMASPSETTLIVLGVAGAAGLITADAAAFWQMVTAIGLTVTPLLAQRRRASPAGSNSAAGRVRPGPTKGRHDGLAPVIVGFGRVRPHGRRHAGARISLPYIARRRRHRYDQPRRDATAQYRAVRRRLPPRRARPAAARPCHRRLIITMDDPVLAVRITQACARLGAGPADHRARPRHDPCRRALQGRRAATPCPETLESSLQLAEAVLVDLGLAMGPVIASVHEKREDLQNAIKAAAKLDQAPRLRPAAARRRQASRARRPIRSAVSADGFPCPCPR